MPNFILSTNMSLPIPVVGVDPGPTYASDLNNCLTIIDGHDHSSGSGSPITPSGLNINADLTLNDNNLIDIKTLRLFDQISPISGTAPNLGVLYRSGADLYYNDGAGNQIAITTAGSVNAGAGSITGLPSGTASASFAAGTFTWRSATNQAATMDMGGLIIRESGVTSANGISLVSPTALGGNYSITLLAALPGSTQVLNISSSGNMGAISYDGIGQGMTSVGANAIQASTTRATGTSVGTGGVAISGNVSFSTSSTSYVDATNATVTITSSGRPIQIMMVATGTTGVGGDIIEVSAASTTNPANQLMYVFVQILRDATVVAEYSMGQQGMANSSSTLDMRAPCSSIAHVDAIGAGTYVYKIQVKLLSSLLTSPTVGISGKLVAYEL